MLTILRENCLQIQFYHKKSARIPLVVTYHPISAPFQVIIQHHLSALHSLEGLQRAVSLPSLIAFCRLRNLRDLLVQAFLTAISQEPPGNRPCRAAGCKTCPIVTTADEFTSHTIGQVFKINFASSYKFSNINYLITCRRCGQQYVGETGQPLHVRISGHRYNITHGKTEESPVAEHFRRTPC